MPSIWQTEVPNLGLKELIVNAIKDASEQIQTQPSQMEDSKVVDK